MNKVNTGTEHPSGERVESLVSQGQGRPWHGKKLKLSPEMQAAVEYAKAHDGKIVRYPGGFWAKGGVWNRSERWFGTTTIEALVARGVAEYTDWQYRKDGSRFPTQITVNAPERNTEAD